MRIQDAVVCVTGASSGIGQAIALYLDSKGARVAMAARRENALKENTARMKHGYAIPTDISDVSQAVAMIEETIRVFGRIDVLINNAAAIIVSRADECEAQDLEYAFRTNLVGPMYATNHAIKYMRAQGYGHIINIGSPSFLIGLPLYIAYSASKGAVTGWTRTLQAEWADTQIKVSEYFPGYIATESHSTSRYGDVPQDVFVDPAGSKLLASSMKPQQPEHVARQIAGLIEKPKPLLCSSAGVAFGLWLSNSALFRRTIGKSMGNVARKRLGLDVFSGQSDLRTTERHD